MQSLTTIQHFCFASLQAEISHIEGDAKKRGQQFFKWPSYSAKVRSELGVCGDFAPWTSLPSIKLHGVPRHCARVIDLINVSWIDVLTQNNRIPACDRTPASSLTTNLFVDISQAVQRRPWKKGIRTIVKNSLLYSFEADCVFSAAMLLRLHGFPNIETELSHSQLQGLAGESWSLPCMATAFYAFVLNGRAPWWA